MSVISSDSSSTNCATGCCSNLSSSLSSSNGSGNGNSIFANLDLCNPLLTFTECNKISSYSLERRIDYHLKRIMKTKRLVYFKNSIENLSIEHRINECLLEIIMSSNNLIGRRQKLLISALELCSQLITLAESNNNQRTETLGTVLQSLPDIKRVVSNIGQLIWALNSNKEHIKYVAKVYSLNDVYTRPGPDSESINIKDKIVDMVQKCEHTIMQCQWIRLQIKQILIRIYL